MTKTTTSIDQDLITYLLRLGDDALILSQRLSEWYALAPRLEDDIALLNLALDQVGHARALLTMVGDREGLGRDEDDLAFLRHEGQFTNARLMEIPNGDFGRTIVQVAVVSAWQCALYEGCAASSDTELSAFAAKALNECGFHAQYATTWLDRLALGTEESAARIQAAVDYVWPYVSELFADDEVTSSLAAAGLVPGQAELQQKWVATVERWFHHLPISLPETGRPELLGRVGRHLEAFMPLIAEMQHVHRAHPGATW